MFAVSWGKIETEKSREWEAIEARKSPNSSQDIKRIQNPFTGFMKGVLFRPKNPRKGLFSSEWLPQRTGF